MPLARSPSTTIRNTVKGMVIRTLMTVIPK
jgi:hypothetical protein